MGTPLRPLLLKFTMQTKLQSVTSKGFSTFGVRSKVPATWIETQGSPPIPSRQPNPSKSSLPSLRRELRHEEIHVVSDSIANFMTGHSHTIQPG